MKNKGLISIIVPIYNVESYVERCISSIINQTYENFELLLVDDGSTDNSGNICKEWASKDPRIRYFYKENGGVCSARNLGLDEAKGDYIGFVDSDDWISPIMYEELYTLLNENNCDLSVCEMYRVTDEGIQKRISQDRVYIFDNGKIDMRLFNTKYILSGRCTQLAKRYIFDYLRFPTNMTLAEDLFLLPDILSQTRKIIYTTKGLYYYYRRKNSACSVFSEFKARNDIDAKKKYFLFLKNNGAYSNIALKWLVDAYAIGYKYLETKDLKKEYNSFFLQNLTNSCFSIKCILFFISPNLYLLIQKYRFNCVRY